MVDHALNFLIFYVHRTNDIIKNFIRNAADGSHGKARVSARFPLSGRSMNRSAAVVGITERSGNRSRRVYRSAAVQGICTNIAGAVHIRGIGVAVGSCIAKPNSIMTQFRIIAPKRKNHVAVVVARERSRRPFLPAEFKDKVLTVILFAHILGADERGNRGTRAVILRARNEGGNVCKGRRRAAARKIFVQFGKVIAVEGFAVGIGVTRSVDRELADDGGRRVRRRRVGALPQIRRSKNSAAKDCRA